MGTLREALQASVAKLEAADPETETPADEPEPVETEAEVEPGEVAEPEAEVEAEAGAEDVAGDGRERGADGRFKPKPGALEQVAQPGQAPAAAAGEPAPVAEPKPAAGPALKAPSSWKPGAREAFAKAPREVQEEAVRVDREVREVMQRAAGQRQFIEAFQAAVAPYEMMIRGEQRGRPYNPIAAVESLFGTAAVLRTGSPVQKTDVLSEIIESYQVPTDALIAKLLLSHRGDPKQLDEAIARHIEAAKAGGRAPGPGAAPPAPYHDPRVDELLAQRDDEHRARQAEFMARGQRDVAAFSADPKNEFYEDVKMDMARLIHAANQGGEEMPLAEAYQTALALPKHAGIQKILKQRADAGAVAERKKAADKARRAGSSIRANPGGSGAPPAPETRRGDIESAWEEHSGAR